MIRRAALLACLVAGLAAASCAGPPNIPTVPAKEQTLPPVPPGRALVIFVWPACRHYIPNTCNDLFDLFSGGAGCKAVIQSTPEERVMCRRTWENRIRVVEKGARLVTDIDVGDYAASIEEPGKHVYAAHHWRDTCMFGRADCVAALEATLEAGKTYVVTFDWKHFDHSSRRSWGRLSFVPIEASDAWYLPQRLSVMRRVELDPKPPDRYTHREIRDVSVGSMVSRRVTQDRRDGVATPTLDGRHAVVLE